MNNKGQSAKHSGQLVILLAVVGLVAFSSAMKDLSQLHQSAIDASGLVASLSSKSSPALEIPPPAVSVETCELNKSLEQSIPSIELPWLDEVAEVEEIEPPQPPQPMRRARVQVVKPARVPRIDFDPVQLEVRVPANDAVEQDVRVSSEFPQFSFKTKTRKHNVIRISPRDREMLLKTLNRSINLRIAS